MKCWWQLFCFPLPCIVSRMGYCVPCCQRIFCRDWSIVLVWGDGRASCTMRSCIKASWWERETGMRDTPFSWGKFISFSSTASFARTWISHQHGLLGACSTVVGCVFALAKENFSRVEARAKIRGWGHRHVSGNWIVRGRGCIIEGQVQAWERQFWSSFTQALKSRGRGCGF